jgi:uncharacterized protein (DUF433 family)
VTAPDDVVFPGTRVPVRALLDWLEQGETVAEFLRYFPSVSREQALAALERTAHGSAGGASQTEGRPRRPDPA